jgi:hypothetical protein
MFSTLLSLAAVVAEALPIQLAVALAVLALVDTGVTCQEKVAVEVLPLRLVLQLLLILFTV